MADRNLWTMCAAASATVVVVGGSAPAALAQQRGATVIGERAVDEETITMRLNYGDLNLAVARGERRLHFRVRGAASSVCQPNDDRGVYRPYHTCSSRAYNGALPQMDLAVRRAREIASRGSSNIPLVAIAVVATR